MVPIPVLFTVLSLGAGGTAMLPHIRVKLL
jgi:hypothetical protein